MRTIFLLALLFLISCGRADKSLTAASRPFTKDGINAGTLGQGANKLYGTKINFTAYKWPKMEELEFPSVSFPSKSGAARVTAVADLVAELGPISDEVDEALYLNTKKQNAASEDLFVKYDTDQCGELTDPQVEEECKQFVAEVITPLIEEYNLLNGKKSSIAKIITQEFDADTANPTNWLKDESNFANYEISLPAMPNSKVDVKFGIPLKLIPGQEQGLFYSLDNGAIRNLEYRFYAGNSSVILTFDLYEMSEQGVYTGNRYHFKLRSKIIPDVGMRLRGDFEVYAQGATKSHDKGMYKLILGELP